MIPSIETIAEDLAAGRITTAQAIAWLYQHAKGATDDLRDYFAARAMQAAATNPKGADGFTFEERAKWAYMQADAMLEARK